MIYLFYGEHYFRKKTLDAWKQAFSKKYSEYNIIHIKNIFEYDLSSLEQILLSRGFFSEKNFVIIDNFPFSSELEEKEIAQKIQTFFLSLYDRISSDHTVVFNNEKIDKKSKLYKQILSNGEIKDFSLQSESDVVDKILEMYSQKISRNALNHLITLKGENFKTIQSEIEKLLIVYETIDIKQLENLEKDVEKTIFDIIHLILSGNKKQFFQILKDFQELQENPYLFYNMLLSNLRIYFYIFKLKELGKSASEIKEVLDLGKRAFLVDKPVKISSKDFYKIYKNLLELDSKMKTGKMIGNENNDFIFEIEKSFLIV